MPLAEMIADPAIWASFFVLVVLEIVLGIDNILFIAVVAGQLPEAHRRRARNFGLALALGLRLALVASAAWIVTLTTPIVTYWDFALSWRDLMLFSGGLFLLYKASSEIHNEVTHATHAPQVKPGSGAILKVIGSIAIIDVVFSVDSVVVAVGLVEHVEVMMAAVVVAVIFMSFTAGPVSRFVTDNPTTRMLALAFLLMIGAALVADGAHIHFDRKPIYVAMAFAAAVELLNLLRTSRRQKKMAAAPAGTDQADRG